MAKQKIDLPSTDSVINNQIPHTGHENHQAFAKAIQDEVMHSMNIPSEQLGYVSRHIDVKMNREQAVRFKALMRRLEDENRRLKDGTPVNNKRRAVLWLIENS